MGVACAGVYVAWLWGLGLEALEWMIHDGFFFLGEQRVGMGDCFLGVFSIWEPLGFSAFGAHRGRLCVRMSRR